MVGRRVMMMMMVTVMLMVTLDTATEAVMPMMMMMKMMKTMFSRVITDIHTMVSIYARRRFPYRPRSFHGRSLPCGALTFMVKGAGG